MSPNSEPEIPMARFLLPFVCLFSLLAATLPAQGLRTTLTGKIEKAPAGACNTAATHRVACTQVLLKSATVDLDSFLNKVVDLEGGISLGIDCVTIDVATAEPAAAATNVIAFLGYRINQTIVYTTTAPAGAIVAYFFSADSGFLPLPFVGTMLLDLPTTQFWTTDVSIGLAIRTMRIPNDPTLVGLKVWYQTGYLAIAPTLGIKLLNPGCFTVVQ